MLFDCGPAAGGLLIALPLLITFLLNLGCAAAVYLDDARHADDVAAGEHSAAVLEKLLRNSARLRTAVKLCSYLSVVLTTVGWLFVVFRGFALWVRVLVLLFHPLLFLAVCVASPRRIAAYSPQKLAYGLCSLLRLWYALMLPATALVQIVSSFAVRLTGKDPQEEPTQVTEEEIRMLVDEGEESGAIEPDEKKMINSIFEFDDRSVAEVMTHRTEVHAIPVTASLHEAVALAMESGNTRMPVYEEDIDTICGILNAKDLLRFLEKPQEFSMRRVMREPLYVPETCSCADVFRHMQQQKTQLAVVVDEYGGTYGIVTMEDLLETIVGSIQDEYDEEPSEFTPAGENAWLLSASLGLSEVENRFEIRFPDDSEADTIGGYLAEQSNAEHGENAANGVVVSGWRFTAAETDDRRIHTVRAEKLPEETESESN